MIDNLTGFFNALSIHNQFAATMARVVYLTWVAFYNVANLLFQIDKST